VKQTRTGLTYGIGAHTLWGIFPFYFGLIGMVGPFEVVPWRVIATLVFCAILVTLSRRWGAVSAILRKPKQFGWFALSSLLLYANWQIFIVGVMTGHVIETSLGYFINPLFSVLIGLIVWRERLTKLQWIAVAVAALGVLTAAVAYGRFPWIALGLAVTFGLYGAVHKHAGADVDGVTGLTVETLASVPVGLVQLVVVASVSGLNAFSFGPGIGILVLFSGVMTAVPLILFGEAARRLPLSYLGFVQFLTPILSFLYGYLVVHEEISAVRWVGFAAVWIALVLLLVDMFDGRPRSPRAEPSTGPVPVD